MDCSGHQNRPPCHFLPFDTRSVCVRPDDTENASPRPSPLLPAAALLREVFPDDEKRPSVRWLRKMQTERLIPYRKLGRFVFFDPAEVRSALDKAFSVRPRGE